MVNSKPKEDEFVTGNKIDSREFKSTILNKGQEVTKNVCFIINFTPLLPLQLKNLYKYKITETSLD